nr:myoD family inhibitor domain-containing protein-like [Pseudochaenichthys georgianus]
MLSGDQVPEDGTEEQSSPTKGSASLKAVEETLPARDPVSRGNTTPPDLISTQPRPAAARGAEASQEGAGLKRPQCDLQRPTCPRCGLTAADHRLPRSSTDPRRPPPSLLQGLSVHSGGSRRSGGAGSHPPTATPAATDSCLQMLLACLSCQCSVLILGLLEACSSCLHTFCASCCHACARCCSAIQEVPVEELNCHAHCHSVMFESCCEPTELLEFCLECCGICHRS